MTHEEQVRRMTEMMAKFVGHTGKKLPDDVIAKLEELRGKEDSPMAKVIYDTMFRNQELAVKLNRPSCQDTGVLQFWVKCGTRFPLIDDLEALLREAVIKATFETPLRHNSVQTFDEYNTGKNVGKKVRTHYRGTFNDGTQFDSSYDRGEPLEFICGIGQMIKGFDAAVADMEVGEIKEVHLSPAEAYGESDPNAIFSVEIARMPGAESVSVGQRVYLRNAYGQPVPVKVVAKDETTITFDANHEMAGKELNFTIELIEVSE